MGFMCPGGKRSGAQSVERALRLLNEIAVLEEEGARLSELARRLSLQQATARRLLCALIERGYVEQDRQSRRYFLGLEVFSLAAAASNRFDLAATTRQSLLRLSDLTDAACAIMLRAGDDLLCVHVSRSAGEICGDLAIGSRLPLVSGAFGTAVLAALTDPEVEDIVLRTVHRLTRAPEAMVVSLRERLVEARRNGFAIQRDPANGRHDLAVAVVDRDGRPQAAIGFVGSMVTACDRDPHAEASVLALEARRIEEALWRHPGSGAAVWVPGASTL